MCAVRSSARQNPFNSEVLLDESHYGVMPANPIENSLTLSNSELGIAEDHLFSGRFGMSSAEELELAIENCKELIAKTEERSERQKLLVKKLIDLRIKLLEIKEGAVEPVFEAAQVLQGHKFVQQNRSSSNRYCEHCNGIIWVVLQPWCRCKFCGYSCHIKCASLIRRTCASVVVQESPKYELQICPEQGLAAQKYRCAECKTKISHSSKLKEQEPRLCDFNGLYYCPNCHWNDEMVIPSRVVHNWDFMPRKVSRVGKQFLKLMLRKPVLHLESLNTILFNYSEDLRLIRKLRSDILIMKCYFLCCKQAAKDRLLCQLKRRQHFVEDANFYSLQDLIDVQFGQLLDDLRSVIESFTKHIKQDCEVCKGNGFMCELCSDKHIIFPFDEYIAVCRECCAVYHRLCFEKQRRHCPRCKRRARRASELASVDDVADSVDEPDASKSETTATYTTSSGVSVVTSVSTCVSSSMQVLPWVVGSIDSSDDQTNRDRSQQPPPVNAIARTLEAYLEPSSPAKTSASVLRRPVAPISVKHHSSVPPKRTTQIGNPFEDDCED